MEGPTGIKDGYFLSAGKFYTELVFDMQVLRIGFGIVIRRDLGRITVAVGPLRAIMGYLRLSEA